MKKNIFAISASVGMITALALPAFAATAMPSPSPKPGSAAAIACVGAAVNMREQTLDSAMMTFTQGANGAYSARAAALQQAYMQTGGNSAIRTAVKAAWTTFTTSMRTARKAWQSARTSAWEKFRTDAKACKAPATISDSANATSEPTVQ